MPAFSLRAHRSGLLVQFTPLLLAVLLGGCATTRQTAVSSTSLEVAAASAKAPPPAPPQNQPVVPAATSQKPFKDVIKAAQRIEGFLPIYHKDDKFWLALRPEDFNKPMFYAVQRTQGMGEKSIWGGQMLASGISFFRRAGNDRVQWVAKNDRFIASGNNLPMERAVAQGFSDSLIGAVPVVSQPDALTQAVLVEVSSLLLNDISGEASNLEKAFKQTYSFDRLNSQVLSLHNTEEETGFDTRIHYALARVALGPLGLPAGPLPTTVPDVRSLFMEYHYSFSALPEPMHSRAADPRVGYFFSTQWDYGNDMAPTPRVHHILRWRLEKQNPQSLLSEPKKPIVFWIDRNVPQRYRQAVHDGILWWNNAFERIGYRNAIVVQQQEDDAAFSTAERSYASVKWFVGVDNALAIGPSQADPRTGEILDADVIISDFWSRNPRRELVRDVPSSLSSSTTDQPDTEACSYSEMAFGDMQDTLKLLTARGEIQPDSPEAETLVQDTIRSVVAHEVGHALGLSHNFRASASYSLAQLRNPAFVDRYGISASIMDYMPVNTPLRGEKPTAYVQKVLGPYDYWAIEYGYKEVAPDNETAELTRIAQRATREPFLAFGNDVDAGDGNGQTAGMDPDTGRFDLGNDSAAYFTRRLALTRELWDWLAKEPAREDPYYSQTRSAIERSLGMLTVSAQNLTRNVGGIRMRRATDGNNRDAFTPVSPPEQRAALNTLARGLFSTDSFRIDPALLRRLMPDQFSRTDGTSSSEARNDPVMPLLNRVLTTQSAVLDQLLNDRITRRIQEASLMNADPRRSFTLAELMQVLQQAIWQEVNSGGNIDLMRRNLQRAYLLRLTYFILHPVAGTPADMRSLARMQAQQLDQNIARELQGSNLNTETRAHLQEAHSTLTEMLRAPLIRQNP